MSEISKNRHYIVYQLTNKSNGMIYVGCHITDVEDFKPIEIDSNLSFILRESGLKNFNVRILHCFDNIQEMYEAESEIVNLDFINRTDTYNNVLGGNGTFKKIRYARVKDSNGNEFRVHKNDERHISGKWEKAVDWIWVKDSEGKIQRIKNDDSRYISGELVGVNNGKHLVKDANDKYYMLPKDDPRIISGELVYPWSGKRIDENIKKKIGKTNSIKQAGKLNSQSGTCWITDSEGKNKKIKTEELDYHLKNGYVKGRIGWNPYKNK